MKNLLIPALCFFLGCNQQTAPSLPPTTPEPVMVAISLKQVVHAFETLPVTKAIVYDANTDPNSLLGRPGQYVEKMNFYDSRDKQKKSECSIEIFRNTEDAASRKNYLDAIGKSSSMFASYSYLHKNVLVRISFGVLPSDADVYRQTLETL